VRAKFAVGDKVRTNRRFPKQHGVKFHARFTIVEVMIAKSGRRLYVTGWNSRSEMQGGYIVESYCLDPYDAVRPWHRRNGQERRQDGKGEG